MQILCITEMKNTSFESDIYTFICTRKILAEKMMSETFFKFLSCSSQVLFVPMFFTVSHVLFVFPLVCRM